MWQNVFVIWSGQTIPKNAGSLDSCKFTHDCVSSDGTAPHYRLQRRKGKEARLVALVVTSDSVYQGAPAILHIDDDYCPHGENYLAIGKFHGTAESKLFFPIVSLGIPNHGPKGFKSLRVKINNLARVAVIRILRCDFKTIGFNDFPTLFQRQVVPTLTIEWDLFLSEISQHFRSSHETIVKIGDFAAKAIYVIKVKFSRSYGRASLNRRGAADTAYTGNINVQIVFSFRIRIAYL